MKTKLRNQPDRLWKPLRTALRVVAGQCPFCIALTQHMDRPAVIYRRSRSSVTFKCLRCGLQWSVTFAVIHRAVLARQGDKVDDDPRFQAVCEILKDATRLNADYAAQRSTSITRQKQRRVIRLPDQTPKAG
jgi:hypothetical protein